MKIIRNKEYNLLMSNVKAIENDKDELEYNYKKQIQHYEHLIDKIYEDLRELKGNIKCPNISKKTVICQIDKIIRKIGGK